MKGVLKMPTLDILATEVAPVPSKGTNAEQEARSAYEGFIWRINEMDDKVGKLTLEGGERLGSVRMRLSHAARRLNKGLEVWQANGNLYFKVVERKTK